MMTSFMNNALELRARVIVWSFLFLFSFRVFVVVVVVQEERAEDCDVWCVSHPWPWFHFSSSHFIIILITYTTYIKSKKKETLRLQNSNLNRSRLVQASTRRRLHVVTRANLNRSRLVQASTRRLHTSWLVVPLLRGKWDSCNHQHVVFIRRDSWCRWTPTSFVQDSCKHQHVVYMSWCRCVVNEHKSPWLQQHHRRIKKRRQVLMSRTKLKSIHCLPSSRDTKTSPLGILHC